MNNRAWCYTPAQAPFLQMRNCIKKNIKEIVGNFPRSGIIPFIDQIIYNSLTLKHE